MNMKVERTIGVKAFTEVLAAQPTTIFSFKEKDGQRTIDWYDKDWDEKIFAHILSLLEFSVEMDDEQFVEEMLPAIEKELNESPLFTALKSPEVVVTKAHTGVTPYEHTMNVVRALKTEALSDRDRLMLRLLALYHDIGKGSAAGLNRSEILALMDEHNHTWHSHPSHAEVAGLALRELVESTKKNVSFDEDFWDDFELIVLEHHLFQDIGTEKTTSADAVIYFQLLGIKNLAVLYFLARADVGSTPEHHEFWPRNVRYLVDMFAQVWDGMDVEAARAFFLALSLPEKLE